MIFLLCLITLLFIPPGGGGIVIPEVGDTVNIGDVDYLVVHIDETNKQMYFAKKYADPTENTQFNPSSGQTTCNGSVVHEKCKTWYNEKIPETVKSLLVTLDCGYGCPVFIPTLAQVASTTKEAIGYYRGSGEWSYFADDEARKFKNESGAAQKWWLQSQWPDSPSSLVCVVYADGCVHGNYPNFTNGFRPCFCMDISSLYIAKQASILQEIFGS